MNLKCIADDGPGGIQGIERFGEVLFTQTDAAQYEFGFFPVPYNDALRGLRSDYRFVAFPVHKHSRLIKPRHH